MAEATQDQPSQVPGLNLPIDYELPRDKRFLHGVNEWAQDPRLTAREISMLKLMDALTDKPNWNQKVLDPDIVARWRQEALSLPLISEPAWEWCLLELRDKAKYFEKNGFVLTLETGSRCAKSDTLIDDNLRSELCNSVEPLLRQEEKDWHPHSNEQVLNLVHPSLFPLVYGRSLVLESGDATLDNYMDKFGKGNTLTPNQQVRSTAVERARRYPDCALKAWSNTFQWLPCEVQFKQGSETDVRIISYINNLHPSRHQTLYAVIEKMIAKSIPLWNEVLIRDAWTSSDPSVHISGRTPPRIQTFGHESEPSALPDWINGMVGRPDAPGYDRTVELVKEYLSIPDNPDLDRSDEHPEEWEQKVHDETWIGDGEAFDVVEWKFRRIRRVLHPEPGVAYTYEDWKAGRTDAAIIGPGYGRYRSTLPLHNYYDVNLQDEFRDKGLQVIVKLASIELTPEKPDYPGGNWHLEGMLNEHIVATSIYYYDVANTTDSRISFRQEDSLDDMQLVYDQDDHEPLSEIFGTETMRDEPSVQELGAVLTKQGRLLCFPNTLQHKVEPFSLADKTQPGHRRFLVLWLVDPHYRIISTANVPPQQHHWWEPHALKPVLDNSGLPTELQDMVREETGEWPIGLSEAKELRLQLMAERTEMMPTVERNFNVYNLCEH